MCKQSRETVEHLLLLCLVARELWLDTVSWVMPKTVNQMLTSWQGRFNNHMTLKIWKDVPMVVKGEPRHPGEVRRH
jgi:hypothetical protein